MAFPDFLEACKNATRSDATLVWIPKQFRHERGLEPDVALHNFGGNFPLWLPEPTHQGLYRVLDLLIS